MRIGVTITIIILTIIVIILLLLYHFKINQKSTCHKETRQNFDESKVMEQTNVNETSAYSDNGQTSTPTTTSTGKRGKFIGKKYHKSYKKNFNFNDVVKDLSVTLTKK